MPSGLRRGTVTVEAHNDIWEAEAAEIVSLLTELLGNDISDIPHIGSTSIEGICAKPIIDIAVGVRSFDDIH